MSLLGNLDHFALVSLAFGGDESVMIGTMQATRIRELEAENKRLLEVLETEQTMHRAWRKRAEEAEERELGLTPPTPEQRKAIEDFGREMQEKAIPQIIAAVDNRERLAAEARTRTLTPDTKS